MGKLAVLLDIAVRCGVMVAIWLLIREFWAEGVVRLLIPLLGAYLIWNVWVIGRSSRSWKLGESGDSSYLQMIGALSLARLLWLVPLADDLWWQHRNRLMVLVAASVVCTILAIGEGIRLASVRPSRSCDRTEPGDLDGQVGSSRP
jgi:hypothetical protein